MSQLLNSLAIWSSNDGTGLNLIKAQLNCETRFLQKSPFALDKELVQAIKDGLAGLEETLIENIHENFDYVIEKAAKEAAPVTQRRGTQFPFSIHILRATCVSALHLTIPPNIFLEREWAFADFSSSSTFKAIVRRNGCYCTVDLNQHLADPIIKGLATNWERTFARKLPTVLGDVSKGSSTQLTIFHNNIEIHCLQSGVGVFGKSTLRQQ